MEAKHLFLGLLSESRPLISQLVTPQVTLLLRETVERASEPHEPIPDSMDLKVAENAVIVLKQTKKLAKGHHHRMILPIHILAALVAVPGDIAEILANHGIKEEDVMAVLLEDVP